MRVLFISDIHGVKTNLPVIQSLDFDSLVILGDIYHNSIYNDNKDLDNDAVKNFLIANRSKIICTKGNCDSEYDYINLNFPVNDLVTIKDQNLNIYCTHGNTYNYRKLSSFDNPGVLIYGHEHVPYIEKEGDMIYICVGSISRPRYGSKASFCIYENRMFTIYSVDGQIIESITI